MSVTKNEKGGMEIFWFRYRNFNPRYIYPKELQLKYIGMEFFRMYVNRYQTALTCFDIETYTLF